MNSKEFTRTSAEFLSRAEKKAFVIVFGLAATSGIVGWWLKSICTPADDDVSRQGAVNRQIASELPATLRLLEER
jgi:hypothetical protein